MNPVRVTPEDNSTVEVKNNLAAVKEKKQAKVIKTAANNILAKEEIKNLQTAFTIPEKIEPAVTGKANELPEAPVLEVAEKTQLPEEKTEVSEISQPTFAQAAINTVEKIFSGDTQLNEANVASSVVGLAANGLNKLTGKELVSFERKYNEEGQLKKIQIAAGNFGISRTKSR